MSRRISTFCLVFAVTILGVPAAMLQAGPYNEPGIQSTDPNIVDWASGWTNEVRGPMDIANPGAGNASFGLPDNVLGPVECDVYDVISLGDGGELTLTFDPPIYDGTGDDLVVFENGFISGDGIFAELGFVEVSTDGVVFARFPSVSLISTPVTPFGTIDPTDVFYLTGKHPGGNQTPCEGTGSDLSNLAGDPAVTSGYVDLSEISYVKVVDVIGDGSTQDSVGSPIYDPYPTSFNSSGCDLQAVGVINQILCTDADEDGYRIEGGGCGPVDCDDTDPDVHPGVLEGPSGNPICSDTVDNDCDGDVDLDDAGCLIVCTDEDEDGFALEGGEYCGPVDCDDTDAAVNPDATEGPFGDPTCSDGADNDCSGLQDSEDPACFGEPGWDGTAAAEAAGVNGPSRHASDRMNLLLLLLVPLSAIAIQRIRKAGK
jgi:hypothetical protein